MAEFIRTVDKGIISKFGRIAVSNDIPGEYFETEIYQVIPCKTGIRGDKTFEFYKGVINADEIVEIKNVGDKVYQVETAEYMYYIAINDGKIIEPKRHVRLMVSGDSQNPLNRSKKMGYVSWNNSGWNITPYYNVDVDTWSKLSDNLYFAQNNHTNFYILCWH